MREELVEQLMARHPDLFAKADATEMFRIRGIECEDGWYNIIDVACVMLSREVREAQRHIDHVKAYQGSKEDLAEAEARLATALDDLPVLQIVKQKFGTMRFSAMKTNEAQRNYINFAEAMSARTCEVCGNSATLRYLKSGWMKTICDSCLKENWASMS